jgi:lipid A ethanolaminephosphotransferase
MFSGLSREEFSLAKAAGRETLIDVISRSGARIFWRDNDGGCKGVCDRIENEDFNNSDDPAFCSAKGECVDEILLKGLEAKIRESTKDTFVVLHLKGSHGPAYYKRYPKAFERFTPVCMTSDLSSCSKDEIRNAYDNTVLYADHIAAETILMLGRLSDRFATAMMYASDHGESLGESGLYLHGMPYAMAPKEQTQIPMIAWLSKQFMQLEQWDAACIAAQAKLTRSHDHLYPTLLGLMEIETNEYQRSLDMFEECDKRRSSIPNR